MLKPKHPCASPNCREVTDRRYCSEHFAEQRAKQRTKSPSARAAGYDARWDRYSRGFLRGNPFCCDPFARHRGQIVRATVTGHKLAHKGNETLLWDRDNHYPLCSGCNSYQCAKYEGGFGNRIEGETKAKLQANVINMLHGGTQRYF